MRSFIWHAIKHFKQRSHCCNRDASKCHGNQDHDHTDKQTDNIIRMCQKEFNWLYCFVEFESILKHDENILSLSSILTRGIGGRYGHIRCKPNINNYQLLNDYIFDINKHTVSIDIDHKPSSDDYQLCVMKNEEMLFQQSKKSGEVKHGKFIISRQIVQDYYLFPVFAIHHSETDQKEYMLKFELKQK